MSAESCTRSHDIVSTLYRDHHDWLRGWLRLKLGDAHQAADLAQDTFVRLLSADKATATDTTLREPRAYLRTIANRLVVDHWRRIEIERAYLAVLHSHPQASWPSEEERFLILESLEQIAEMLGRLKPLVREVFLLAQMDGLSCPQIARQIGKSVATVERYLAQALQHCYRLTYGQ
ncbi:sigma-70 family RNA polymerase sigma factor [Alcaligenaceae bacterium SJ-26]|nr:sigma-70 family RNA polymerase sigma factor [Alcaligenaceae bacterium SJ-26]